MKTKKRMLAHVTEVVILKDCRDGARLAPADGQKALFLGRYRLSKYPELQRYRGPRAELSNPVFRLPDGSLVWGIQCWWRRADEPEGALRTESLDLDVDISVR